MRRRLRIALLIESSRAYGRNLLYGVESYARACGPWTFYFQERSIDDPMPAGLRNWRPHGLLVRIVDAKFGRQVRSLGVPAVDLLGQRSYRGIPSVVPDQPAIVRSAADHLLQRGLRQFAYAGFRGLGFSDERCDAFRKYMQAKGFPVQILESSGPHRAIGLAGIEEKTSQQVQELAAWLQGLPKPVGLFGCNDVRANQILAVCSENGIRVPDDVAVIGVDNDLVVCQLSDPPLSSVDPNAQKIGYEAAALLHRMIEGSGTLAKNLSKTLSENLQSRLSLRERNATFAERKATMQAATDFPVGSKSGTTSEQVLVEPAGVVSRRSTDVLAIADQEVVDAVRYIREHACDGLALEDLAERAVFSRRTLQRRFAQYVGHSPSEEITRVRLERVQELLIATDFSLDDIARSTGFSHPESMHRLFKNTFGLTPGEYRKSQKPIGTAEMPLGLDS